MATNVFHRNNFATVQPAARRLARALYHRLNEPNVDEVEKEHLLASIAVIREGVFDVHAPIDAPSRNLFINALQHFVAAEVALADETDDAFVDEIRPFSALIDYYQQQRA